MVTPLTYSSALLPLLALTVCPGESTLELMVSKNAASLVAIPWHEPTLIWPVESTGAQIPGRYIRPFPASPLPDPAISVATRAHCGGIGGLKALPVWVVAG